MAGHSFIVVSAFGWNCKRHFAESADSAAAGLITSFRVENHSGILHVS